MASKKRSRMQWYRIDLHLHTPASADYQDSHASYIDILRTAEARGVDIVSFTDHNTVGGYAAMLEEINRLTYLEELGRANADEMRLLAEYRRLTDKILVLPGFEFTATFGFHILGIFPPETSVRQLEYLLLHLNVPPSALDNGTSEVGASSDVLTAYRLINEAGGICIAAHANAAHGVAMRGLDFGGQTRIAYTQDRNLHALEVTDLNRRDRRSTQRFFDGTKSEYPRRMRCIQGSDAHALHTIHDRNNRRIITLGVGERVTEVLLAERSFDALHDMFTSNDFSRSRPYNPNRQPDDFIQSAREEGPSIIQSFHESMERKGGKMYNIISDVCAFANTNGGTIYVGISPDKKKKPVGIDDPKAAIETLRTEISQTITPALSVELDAQETQGKTVIRLQVPYGEERPYAIDTYKIYVRDEAETTQAVRDEIVNLVRQGMVFQQDGTPSNGLSGAMRGALNAGAINSVSGATINSSIATETTETRVVPDAPQPPVGEAASVPTAVPNMPPTTIAPPRTGVEIVDVSDRDGTTYYIMHDLRNGNIVRNVTMSSARKLWHYAIKQYEGNPVKPEKVEWNSEIGLWRRYKKSGDVRYDLVQRVGDNDTLRVFYGVTENGMHEAWQGFLDAE